MAMAREDVVSVLGLIDETLIVEVTLPARPQRNCARHGHGSMVTKP